MNTDKEEMLQMITSMFEGIQAPSDEGIETVFDTEEECLARARQYALLKPGTLVRMRVRGKSPRKGIFVRWVDGSVEQPVRAVCMFWGEDKTIDPIICPVWVLEVLP